MAKPLKSKGIADGSIYITQIKKESDPDKKSTTRSAYVVLGDGVNIDTENTTYTFADTSDGWSVQGTDGSSFTHTDMGGPSINVVQTTGESTEDVMSQNAVSAQLNALHTEIGNIENILHQINNGDES